MIAAADFAPWPVWCLVRREPRLEGLPLAVVAGARVVAASPAARAAGVRVGMSADLARSKTGGLELRPLPPGLEAAWETLLHELNRYTPRLEAPHPGLVYLDLSPADARLLAGEYRVPVGLGPTREDARLAAATALPGEVRVVDDPEAFLEGFPVEHLAAVGLPEEGLARLRWLGIETAGQLAAWSRTQLLAFLPGAERILPYLKGPKTDRVAVFEPAPRVRRALEFPEQVEAPYATRALDLLAGELVTELGKRAARRLLLEVEAGGMRFFAERRPKEPLCDKQRLRHHLEAALKASGALAWPVERIEATLTDLVLPGVQEGLFRRAATLDAAIRRFPAAFWRAVIIDPRALAPEYGFVYVPWEAGDATPAHPPRRRGPRHPVRDA